MGTFRIGLIFFMVLAIVADSSFRLDGDSPRSGGGSGNGNGCSGHNVGDCITKAEEMMSDNENHRRFLGGRGYISYDSLRANRVPCNRRGQSYYNCNQRGRANPYRRGCSRISRCARYTN
ncbi:rapid alkalinization factor-like [Cornus florida]|uniref:rapid alkalinization factor-like n=1 Tax=Cornus florida TaxID=4283 RepID=UPI00289F2A99|nr:rapid alkalinization factor-like [Cornus florida]